MRVPSPSPRGTTSRTWTSASARRMPSRSRGTISVPPASATAPSPSSATAASTDSGRRSSNGLRLACLLAPPLLRLAQRAQHLLAVDGERAHVGAGRVADRVGDGGGGRDDRRLAEP